MRKYDPKLMRAVVDAIIKWKRYDARSSITVKNMYEFTDFLGDPYPVAGDRLEIVQISKPEIRRAIELINGPNGNAILKMLELKRQGVLDEG